MPRLEGNIKKFYIFSFLSNILFYGPVFLLFFQNFGLSFTQITFFLTAYSVTVIALDIPTGVFSDYFGRKKTLLVGVSVLALAFALLAAADSYPLFLLAYVLMGVGNAFESGTGTSMIYDSLKALRKEGEWKRIAGSLGLVESAALTASFLVGGFIFAAHFRLPYALTAAAVAIQIPLLLSMVEPPRRKAAARKMRHMKESVLFVARHPQLKWLTILFAIFLTAVIVSFFVNQAYLKLIGLRPEQFGIVLAASTAIGGAASKLAYRIERKIGENASLAVGPASAAAAYLFLSQISAPWGVAFIFLMSFSIGFSVPLFSDYVNRHVESKNRATVLSIQNSIRNVSFAVFGPLMGWAADLFSLQTAFLIAGILVFAAAAPVLFFTIRAHRGHK